MVSKKKEKSGMDGGGGGRGGVKNYILHLQSVSGRVTQHLSSSLRHGSGTKELARQTMSLRREEKRRRAEERWREERRDRREEKRREGQETSKSAGGGRSWRRRRKWVGIGGYGFSYLMPETEL